MVSSSEQYDAAYQCPECGLHYRDEATAKACQQFCSKHHACSMEIARQSFEYERSYGGVSEESS